MDHTPLLIVGAGPFGLALAAHARELGIEHRVVGKAMGFWTDHMPAGMLLRSGIEWHLDPAGEHTIERYLAEKGLRASDVQPLSLDSYLGYARWFQVQKRIEVLPARVQRLDRGNGHFTATLAGGESITAESVVLALGMGYFANLPEEYTRLLPAGRYTHTSDLVDLGALAGERCLIVGGRQSAYETAALLWEVGATQVHVVHRHPAPAFTESDWSWVPALVERTESDPGWYRRLTPEQRAEVQRRFWTEGRLKLEPWLAGRIREVRVWPESRVVAYEEAPDGALRVRLDGGAVLEVDQVILATGYKVEVSRVPFLARGQLLAAVATSNGFPVLDEHFQSSAPGLYFTSFAATQDFGPFFAFTVSVRSAARIIGTAITGRHQSAPAPPPSPHHGILR